MRALVLLLTAACLAGAQHQALIDYLERRLLAIEDRITLWHEQTTRYAAELRELKQQMVAQLDSLDKEKESLRLSLDGVGGRVDRVEREMDYMETQNGAPPCVDVDDKLVEQQVTQVKERNKARYAQLSDCSEMISSIKAMKIVKKLGGPKGMWTKDVGGASGKVYVLNGTDQATVYEFASLRDFTASPDDASLARALSLPSPWQGTGHLVYEHHLYYVSDQLRVLKYDLRNASLADSAVFPAADHVPVYGLTPETVIDLAADEEGLWVVHATRRNLPPRISLAKMDAATLDLEQSWDTPCPTENAEAAFVICGALYVVYNAPQPGRSRVQCVFDVNGLVSGEEAPLVYFPKRYGAHSSLKYNPREQLLYAWDDGYQMVYRLVMKPKLEV